MQPKTKLTTKTTGSATQASIPPKYRFMQGLYHRCTIKGMYRSVAGGAYYGMNLGADGLSGLGAFPQPTTDALAASWCTAKGIPPAYCSIAPGIIDPSGALHIVSDPSGQPCTADSVGGPCTWNDFGGVIDPAILAGQGISVRQQVCTPDQAQNFPAGSVYSYYPQSCNGTVLLSQAQTLSLLAALGQSPTGLPPVTSNTPVGTPLSSAPVTQGVYADPTTAAQVASQIPGASVQQTSGGYAVIQPGNASTTPVTPYVPPSTTPPASGGSIPSAGNSQAAPPSSNMWCFPGDTSAEIMPNVPVCQNTALAALGALLVLVLVLK